MRVEVEVLPWLSTYLRPGTTGRVHFDHQMAGSTLGDLLQELSGADPGFARLIYDPEARVLRQPVVATVNDQLLEFVGGLQVKLSEGDSVSFIPGYTGG